MVIWLLWRHVAHGLGRVCHLAQSVEILSDRVESVVVVVNLAEWNDRLGERARAPGLVVASVDVVCELLEPVCGLCKLE